MSRREVSHAWLLAVVAEQEALPLHHLTETIESGLRSLVSCTVVVLSAAQYAGWLANGHPFAIGVHTKGFLLHPTDGDTLPQAAAAVNGAERQKEAARLAAQTRARVANF